MNRCETCHWWCQSFDTKDDRRVCVWHTGSKDVAARKIDFGGNKSLRTTADFGCVCWEESNKPNAVQLVQYSTRETEPHECWIEEAKEAMQELCDAMNEPESVPTRRELCARKAALNLLASLASNR